jgi:hypothetical protein
MTDTEDLSRRIDAIEAGYEFLLAYAAQGRLDDAGSDVRQALTDMAAALDGLGDVVAASLDGATRPASSGQPSQSMGARKSAPSEATRADIAEVSISATAANASRTAGHCEAPMAPFIDAVREDARKAGGAIALVLSRPAIGSLLIDNLNASVHLRALLTDLFLIEQALRPQAQP